MFCLIVDHQLKSNLTCEQRNTVMEKRFTDERYVTLSVNFGIKIYS